MLCDVGKHSASCCPLDTSDNSRWAKPLSVTNCECHDACNEAFFRDHRDDLLKDGTLIETQR